MGNARIEFSVYSFLANRGAGDLLIKFLTRKLANADGAIVVADDNLLAATRCASECAFLVSMDGTLGGANVQNYFRKLFSRVLKNYSRYTGLFEDKKFRKMFLLPLANFVADEITEMKNIFANEAASVGFSDALDRVLKDLRNRQRPKRKGEDYDFVYVRDDRMHFFRYGPEKHSQLETGMPPHRLECGMNGHFRFGLKFDNEQHFNVSVEGKDAKISGNFFDCHDTRRTIAARSHINMFPNGFF